MKNFIDSLVVLFSAAVLNLVKILKDIVVIDFEICQKFGVLDVVIKRWLIKFLVKNYVWGVIEIYVRKYYVVFLEYDEYGVVICDSWRRVVVSSELMVYFDMVKFRILRRLLRDGEFYVSSVKVVLVDGVLGCGKIKEIFLKVNFEEDLILVLGKQVVEMIKRCVNVLGII